FMRSASRPRRGFNGRGVAIVRVLISLTCVAHARALARTMPLCRVRHRARGLLVLQPWPKTSSANAIQALSRSGAMLAVSASRWVSAPMHIADGSATTMTRVGGSTRASSYELAAGCYRSSEQGCEIASGGDGDAFEVQPARHPAELVRQRG